MEVMITVAIIGILAGILIISFNDAPKKAKAKSEVNAMFAELHNREAEYKLEHGVYYSTGGDEGDIFPDSPSTTAQDATSLPDEWLDLKVSPASEKLYCGYVAIAGTKDDPIPGFAEDFGMDQPTVGWYVLYAECDQDGSSTLNGTFFSSSIDVTMQYQNETH